MQVSFKELNVATGGKSEDNIGSATTGADGRFEIKCKYYSSGTEIEIFNAKTRYVYCANYDYSAYPKKGYYDFGTCFAYDTKFSGILRVHLNGSYSPSDTLYIGNGRETKSYTNLISGATVDFLSTAYFTHSFFNVIVRYNRESANWDIGYANFLKYNHRVNVIENICMDGDTVTEISVNR